MPRSVLVWGSRVGSLPVALISVYPPRRLYCIKCESLSPQKDGELSTESHASLTLPGSPAHHVHSGGHAGHTGDWQRGRAECFQMMTLATSVQSLATEFQPSVGLERFVVTLRPGGEDWAIPGALLVL